MEVERQGVVLAGGGAHGAYAVGVLEALLSGRWQRGRHGPFRPSIFTGTSVGAYSASILAQHGLPCGLENVRFLRELWLERIAAAPGTRGNGVFYTRGFPLRALLSSRPFYSSGIPLPTKLWLDLRSTTRIWLRRILSLGFSGESLLRRLVRIPDLGDLLSTEPMQKLIADTIDPRALLNPGAGTLRIATTHWDRGHTVIFCNHPDKVTHRLQATDFEQRALDKENTHEVIRASASIPGLCSQYARPTVARPGRSSRARVSWAKPTWSPTLGCRFPHSPSTSGTSRRAAFWTCWSSVWASRPGRPS